jgi:GTP-binding protein
MHYSFVDEVVIQVRSGAGGPGCVAFRREKFLPFGGPSGGNGGRGGDVIVRTDPQLNTLLDFRYAPRQFAADGVPGSGRQCTGANGESLIVRVPVGTLLTRLAETDADALPDGPAAPVAATAPASKSKPKSKSEPAAEPEPEVDRLLVDLDAPDQSCVVARGGRGGKGNEHFKTSVRQAPDYAQPGEPGEAMTLRLTLKLLANVGLVGLPNVGKSSLLGRISASRPKVANYPFTTLVPNLGVVQFGDMQHFVVADVPGLVVGASQGIGLGSRFLRHIERVSLIVHMLTADAFGQSTTEDVLEDFRAIEHELHTHGPHLTSLPRVVVLNRIDLPEVAAHQEALARHFSARGMAFVPISAATGEGVGRLVRLLGQRLQDRRGPAAA